MCQANKIELDHSFPSDSPTIVCHLGFLPSALFVCFLELPWPSLTLMCQGRRWLGDEATNPEGCVHRRITPTITRFVGSDPEYDLGQVHSFHEILFLPV